MDHIFLPLKTRRILLRGLDSVATPFRLRDIQFYVRGSPTPATNSIPSLCASADFFSLLFSNQNNLVKVDAIGHGDTGHPRACVVASIIQRVAHFQQHWSGRNTPLDAVHHKESGQHFKSQISIRPSKSRWRSSDHKLALIYHL